jgi:hypothetical protein
MRLTLTIPALMAVLTLTACGSVGTTGKDGSNDFPQVCNEQSAMAQTGLTGGGMQTITCPN